MQGFSWREIGRFYGVSAHAILWEWPVFLCQPGFSPQAVVKTANWQALCINASIDEPTNYYEIIPVALKMFQDKTMYKNTYQMSFGWLSREGQLIFRNKREKSSVKGSAPVVHSVHFYRDVD